MYFPMSNNQRDPSTMFYLKDPLPSSHSETQPSTIMYTNFPSSSGPYSDALPVISQSHTNSMNVPSVASDSNTSQQEVLLNFGGSRALENQLNSRNEMMTMMMMMENSCVLQGGTYLQGQGLSLSISTNVPPVLHVSPIQYQNESTDFSSILGGNQLIEERGRNISFENEDGFQTKQLRDHDYIVSTAPNNLPQYGMPSIARAVLNSKYMRAAQDLLDEVVNVKKGIKDQKGKKELNKEVEGESGNGGPDPSSTTASSVAPKANRNPSTELSPTEKQELQNKFTKLFSMLDEVDRRYRQYYHQMQIVVSSFDAIAGSGAAKTYTALALQTISRHFRCLRDAINGQIQATRKSLGEEDASSNDKGVGISRLRYVDQQLRQQRALQQLGMIQQHAWRPQRGLPETSVSILRAWLFEHFLHPYPKDSEKITLARQTGLTRNQVSNWFINARVRLWKPMVEEMYKEELGDADIDSNSSSETLVKTSPKACKEKVDDWQQHTTSTGQIMESKPDQANELEMMKSSDTNSVFQTDYVIGKMSEGEKQTPRRNESIIFSNADVDSNCGSERFMEATYHMTEMERFGSIGGVSLTLGLQRCEGGGMAMGDGTETGFVPLRESGVHNATGSVMGTEVAEFDCMDSGNPSHRLISSLLPSFT